MVRCILIFWEHPELWSIFCMFSKKCFGGLGTPNVWAPSSNFKPWGYHSETSTRAKPFTASISIAHWYHFQKLLHICIRNTHQSECMQFANQNLCYGHATSKNCCDENSLPRWLNWSFSDRFFGTKHHDKLKHETILVFPKVNEGFFVFNPSCYLGHRLAFSCWTKRFSWHVANGNLVVVGLDSWFGRVVVVVVECWFGSWHVKTKSHCTFESSNTLLAYFAALPVFFCYPSWRCNLPVLTERSKGKGKGANEACIIDLQTHAMKRVAKSAKIRPCH